MHLRANTFDFESTIRQVCRPEGLITSGVAAEHSRRNAGSYVPSATALSRPESQFQGL